MTADVDALRTLAEAATPGPWVLDDGGDQVWDGAQSEGIAHVSWERGLYGEGDSNLRFIAAANPTVVLTLLDELAAARAAVERVRALLSLAEAQTAMSVSCDFNGNKWEAPIPQTALRAALDGAS